MATRAGWRGFGRVAPNPMVGCVLVRPSKPDDDFVSVRTEALAERVLAIGHHRGFGGLHAERAALAALRRAGNTDAAGGCTAYVTLEPCNGHGKQPPCVQALLEASVARVVYAQRDPSATKGGGQGALERAGVKVDRLPHAGAARLSAPWRKHAATGLPWVIVKWAQTIDAKVATRTGDSQWISNERSRRWVHALRGRVDAVLTGAGTVLTDDPLLNARGVRSRKQSLRVVLDSTVRTPPTSRLIRSITETPESGPVLVLALGGGGNGGEGNGGGMDGALQSRVQALRNLGARVEFIRKEPSAAHALLPMPSASAHAHHALRVPLLPALGFLGTQCGVQTLLVEAGPHLVGQLLAQRLVDEILTFAGPVVLADPFALGPTMSLSAGGPLAGEADRLVSSIREAREAEAWRLAWTRSVPPDAAHADLGLDHGGDAMTLWQNTRWLG